MNSTPICDAFRQSRRHRRVGTPPTARTKSSGIPTGLCTLRQAPLSEMSRIVQSIVAPRPFRPLKVICPALRARRRPVLLSFCVVFSIFRPRVLRLRRCTMSAYQKLERFTRLSVAHSTKRVIRSKGPFRHHHCPKSLRSGNFILTKAVIWWMSV
jgi:hypothetical protein